MSTGWGGLKRFEESRGTFLKSSFGRARRREIPQQAER